MATCTRRRVASRTMSGELSTFDTVCRETPAARATSSTVGAFAMSCLPCRFDPFGATVRSADARVQTASLGRAATA